MKSNISIENSDVSDKTKIENVSEYKIGYTTYVVTLHFNAAGESLTEILNRLIGKNAEQKSAA